MFKYQSGRVIALGRAMLAALFLISIWLDRSQPAQAPAFTYSLLIIYLALASAIALFTWRNWWMDARLAIMAHLIDMAMFTVIVFSTDGYTSPFFLFFVLPLLSAAIRWGWRETAITAAALVLLYMAAGLFVAGSQTFELQRFMIRSGHLIILSAVLIWFGVQRFARLSFQIEQRPDQRIREAPFAQALGLAMETTDAPSGVLVLGEGEDGPLAGICIGESDAAAVTMGRLCIGERRPAAALLDLDRDRCLTSSALGRYRFDRASDVFAIDELRRLGVSTGVATQVRTGTAQGWLLLWTIPDLSVDYLELGAELGRSAGAVLERDALLDAIEEGAAGRTRLSLARDVHDSVVQFLAGATFRVEAMMRAGRSGKPVGTDLEELKRLLIEEQGEIRAFVSALRRDQDLELADAVEELKGLAQRLGHQWSVDCRVEAATDEGSIPIRLQFDLQHLLREAVANAVRHGGADRVAVGISVADDELRVEVRDNGRGTGAEGDDVEPWSLKERVERARGSLMLKSRPGNTSLFITLPLNGAAA